MVQPFSGPKRHADQGRQGQGLAPLHITGLSAHDFSRPKTAQTPYFDPFAGLKRPDHLVQDPLHHHAGLVLVQPGGFGHLTNEAAYHQRHAASSAFVEDILQQKAGGFPFPPRRLDRENPSSIQGISDKSND
jgi:hypothetical protein